MLELETEKKIVTGLAIGPMRLEHLAEVYAIEVASYPNPWPVKTFADELTRNQCAHYFVSTIEGAVVGYAGMWIVLDEAHITNIAVDHAYRRRGIGERLLVHMLERCTENDVESVTLEVRRFNLAAQRLYTRYLFTSDGVREKYYADNREDAVMMRIRGFRGEEFRGRFRENVDELNRRIAARADFVRCAQ